jgi:hypothetical protein
VLCLLSLFSDCLRLGDGLLAFLWYMQLERLKMKLEIFELNDSHIAVLVCAADADVLG